MPSSESLAKKLGASDVFGAINLNDGVDDTVPVQGSRGLVAWVGGFVPFVGVILYHK